MSYVKCCWVHGLDPNRITWQDGDTHYPWPGIDASLFPQRHEHHAESRRADGLPARLRCDDEGQEPGCGPTPPSAWWAHELGNNERVFCPDVTRWTHRRASLTARGSPSLSRSWRETTCRSWRDPITFRTSPGTMTIDVIVARYKEEYPVGQRQSSRARGSLFTTREGTL